MIANRASLFLVIGVALAASGCRSSEFVSVEGTVTLDGEPLENAFLTFFPDAASATGTTAFGKTNPDGRYELAVSGAQEGILPGTYRVEITTSDIAIKNGQEYMLPELVPIQYNKETTLTDIEIKPGESRTLDFELKSEGKIAQPRPGQPDR